MMGDLPRDYRYSLGAKFQRFMSMMGMVGDHSADVWSSFGRWMTLFWMLVDHPWDGG